MQGAGSPLMALCRSSAQGQDQLPRLDSIPATQAARQQKIDAPLRLCVSEVEPKRKAGDLQKGRARGQMK